MSTTNLEQWFRKLTERETGDQSRKTAGKPAPPASEPSRNQSQKRRLLRRAVLRWLAESAQPAALGVDVVTRIHRIRADVAAFWNEPVRNPRDEGPERILSPVKTTIVQCYTERDECWPDCIRSENAVPRLTELRRELSELQQEIREREPELRDPASLFEEYAEWHYERTRNPRYHPIRREIDNVEHALYAGTRFERIREAALATELWLAVPEERIRAEELADGWGLLWVSDTLDIEIRKSPVARQCAPENQMHLVQNIASAALPSVLFSNGLRPTRRGVPFVKPPRGHRNPVYPRLDIPES